MGGIRAETEKPQGAAAVNFEQIFDRLLGHEGGYVNHPNDPGGETNWGISKRTYPRTDIKNLTRAQARDIYFQDFWMPLHGDKLFDGVAFQLFDFAVNSGIQTAIRAYQRALGVADDGHFGAMSLAAANAASESDQIMGILAERLDFFTRLNGWDSFGRGWVRRVAADLRYGMQDS
jgi:lysozyme family protein